MNRGCLGGDRIKFRFCVARASNWLTGGHHFGQRRLLHELDDLCPHEWLRTGCWVMLVNGNEGDQAVWPLPSQHTEYVPGRVYIPGGAVQSRGRVTSASATGDIGVFCEQ